MKSLSKIIISQAVLEKTCEELRSYGRRGCEGLVLWLGYFGDDNTCRVENVFVPPQNSLKSEDGVGYFVDSKTLFVLNKHLSTTGLRLLAQVHSHPGRAYHSAADDRYCIVTIEGGVSIVVPDFGFCPADLLMWATYRLDRGRWKELSKKEVKSFFHVEGQLENLEPQINIMSKIKKFFH